ncbi:hypothetical protein D3C80_960670 [compost metagenome]
MQVAAIFHRWVKGDLEGAVRVDRAVGQYIALGIAHLHAGPGFAAAIELGAGQADYQVGCGIRWCGVAAVDVRRGDVAGRGGVAGGVSGGDLQYLAVYLWRVEGDAEAASGVDHPTTQHGGAIGGHHPHGAAHFGAAGDLAAVGTDRQLARGDRWGDIRCGDLHG